MRTIILLLSILSVTTSCKKQNAASTPPEIFQFPQGLFASTGSGHTDTIAFRVSTGSYTIQPYSYTCNFGYACNFEKDRDRIAIDQSGEYVQIRFLGNGKYLKYNEAYGTDWDTQQGWVLRRLIGFTTQLSDSTSFVLKRSGNTNNFSLEPKLARGNFLRIVTRPSGSGFTSNVDFVPTNNSKILIIPF